MSTSAFSEYTEHDGLGLAQLVRNKEVTPSELVEAALEVAGRRGKELNCIVTEIGESARATAKAMEKDLPDAPLAGVPFLLKDLAGHLAGVRNTSGSRYEKDWIADRDATITERFRGAGFIPVGTSSSSELGLLPMTESHLHGPTENPWKRGRTSGGSSGGAGCAVASGIVPIAHGSDGGGSIRIPAACNGVFGLKPTRARTPQGPVTTERWHGFVSGHVLTRSVRDSAAVLDAVHGPELGAPYYVLPPQRPYLEEVGRDPGRLRIAFSTRPNLPGETHPDCRAAVLDAAGLLEALGHHVEEKDLDFIDPLQLGKDFFTIVSSETAAYYRLAEHTHGRPPARGDLEPPTELARLAGERMSGADVCESLQRLRALSIEVARFHEDYDLLLTPTVGLPPPEHGLLRAKGVEAIAHKVVASAKLGAVLKLPGVIEATVSRVYRFIPFPPVANVTGQPSMSVPLCWNAEGLPVGTMFTARFGDEGLLYRLAGQLEAERPWGGKRPPAFG